MQFFDQMSQFGTKAWVRENERRAAYVEALYERNGRDEPDHEHHGCFTGLFQSRVALLTERDSRIIIGLRETRLTQQTRLPRPHPLRNLS